MINVSSITEKQKLTIAKGLCDYNYIMNNWKKNDADFQDVYYSFYLKARWAVMNLPGNKNPYFDKLQSIASTDEFMSILDDLKSKMAASSYEFSLCSKLLHTRNPQSPIYDSKVCDYLTNEENIDFWWHHSPKVRGASRKLSEREKIEHDWIELNTWYNTFLSSPKGNQWIRWFDYNFPSYSSISNVKKIDFIIFATR